MYLATASSGRVILSAGWLIYFKLTIVALLWGGTFIAGRLLADSLAPQMAAIGRFALAALLLIALVWKIEGRLPKLSARQLGITFLLGLTGVFIYNVFFFSALAEMPASRTALFVAFNPVITVILMAVLHREKLALHRFLGIMIAVLGAIIVITEGDLATAFSDISHTFGRGELFMFCAVVSWAVYTVIGRQALMGLTPLVTTTYAALWGFLLLITSAAFGQNALSTVSLNFESIAAIMYLGIFGTVIPFVWYYQGVQRIGAAQTAVFTNLVPVFGVLLGVLLLGEQFSYSMVLGGVLVFTGVAVTNRI